MSMIKRALEDIIERLANKTGYDEHFLMERYNETIDIGGSFDEFISITEEHDW